MGFIENRKLWLVVGCLVVFGSLGALLYLAGASKAIAVSTTVGMTAVDLTKAGECLERVFYALVGVESLGFLTIVVLSWPKAWFGVSMAALFVLLQFAIVSAVVSGLLFRMGIRTDMIEIALRGCVCSFP